MKNYDIMNSNLKNKIKTIQRRESMKIDQDKSNMKEIKSYLISNNILKFESNKTKVSRRMTLNFNKIYRSMNTTEDVLKI